MQKWLLRIWRIRNFLGHANALKKLFDNPFHCKEIAVAVHAKRELHTLIWIIRHRKAFRDIDISKFIETHILISAVIIRCQRSQNSIQGNRSHNREILA